MISRAKNAKSIQEEKITKVMRSLFRKVHGRDEFFSCMATRECLGSDD